MTFWVPISGNPDGTIQNALTPILTFPCLVAGITRWCLLDNHPIFVNPLSSLDYSPIRIPLYPQLLTLFFPNPSLSHQHSINLLHINIPLTSLKHPINCPHHTSQQCPFGKNRGAFFWSMTYDHWLVVSTPLKNMKVSWGYYSQYMEKIRFQTTNQIIFGSSRFI